MTLDCVDCDAGCFAPAASLTVTGSVAAVVLAVGSAAVGVGSVATPAPALQYKLQTIRVPRSKVP